MIQLALSVKWNEEEVKNTLGASDKEIEFFKE